MGHYEILRFDSRRPNPKFIGLIDQLREKLADVLVVMQPAAAAVASRYHYWRPDIIPSRTGERLP